MKKTIIYLFLLLFVAAPTMQAQENAKKILDRAAANLKHLGGMEINFDASSYSGSSLKGSAEGTLFIKGNKFHVKTPSMLTWFDGKTQWTYVKDNGEVNVSNPSQAEQQSINPYTFLYLYRSGFRCTMQEESTLRGRRCYGIRLLANSPRRDIQEMLIDIDKSNYQPVCVRMRQGAKNWTRISIYSIQPKSMSDSEFRFNAKDYPKAEVIDLR